MRRLILILTIIALCGLSSLFLLNYCSANGNSVLKLLFKNTEKKIEIGRLKKSASESIFVKFKLPAEHRSWPLYINSKGSSDNLNGRVKLSIFNHLDGDLIVALREIDENILREKQVKKGEELLIYNGNFETLIYELNKEHRVRPNEEDEYYSEWHPLISISSDDNEKLTGEIKITSEDLTEINQELVLYTYLPPETL